MWGGVNTRLSFFSSIVRHTSTHRSKPAPRGMASQHGHVRESADESPNKLFLKAYITSWTFFVTDVTLGPLVPWLFVH